MPGEWLKGVDLNNLDNAAASRILIDYDKNQKGWLNKDDVRSLVVEWGAANAVAPSEQEAISTKFWECTNKGGSIQYVDLASSCQSQTRLRLDRGLNIPLSYALLPQTSSGGSQMTARKWIVQAAAAVNAMFPKSVLNSSECVLVDVTGKQIEEDTELGSADLARLALRCTPSKQVGTKELTEQEQEAAFARLFELPGNKICADCDCPSPQWTVVNFGIFVCMGCSGVHRSMGTHISQVFSSKLDRWSAAKVDRMRSNLEHNSLYEYHVPDSMPKPHQHSSRELREKYIRAKYETRRFIRGNDTSKAPKAAVYDTASNARVDGTDARNAGMLDTAGILFVTLMEGRHLPKMDVIGSADPYVRLQFGQKQMKSKVVKNSQFPNWQGEKFQFCVDALSTPLLVDVFDWDAGSADDFIGSATVDLSAAINKEADLWVDIKDNGKARGAVRLVLQFAALDH